MARSLAAGLTGLAALILAGCASTDLVVPAHLRAVPPDVMNELGTQRLRLEQPIFIRIFKEESDLEVWKLHDDGRYRHLRTYPICTWSGDLGPKHTEGDKQAPEGFYEVRADQMNPFSKHHLSFNLGFPNAFDRSLGRTGSAIMVHGKCSSAGCYAITDPYMEEVYALAREAFAGGQDLIPVHVFPFRLTAVALTRRGTSDNLPFWLMLKAGYDAFERSRTVPTVVVCDRRYVINPRWHQPLSRPLQAALPCPPHDPQEHALPVNPEAPGRLLPGRRLRSASPAPT